MVHDTHKGNQRTEWKSPQLNVPKRSCKYSWAASGPLNSEAGTVSPGAVNRAASRQVPARNTLRFPLAAAAAPGGEVDEIGLVADITVLSRTALYLVCVRHGRGLEKGPAAADQEPEAPPEEEREGWQG